MNLNNDIMFNMDIYIVYGFTFIRLVQIIFEILLLSWYLSSKQDLFLELAKHFAIYPVFNKQLLYLPLINGFSFIIVSFIGVIFLV